MTNQTKHWINFCHYYDEPNENKLLSAAITATIELQFDLQLILGIDSTTTES